MTQTRNTDQNNPSLQSFNAKGLDQPLNVKDKLDELNKIMYGVVLVVAIGFVTMIFAMGAILFDYLAEKKSSSDLLQSEITQQGDKIDKLTEEIRIHNVQRQLTP
jgi:hypothetical protein